MKTLQKRISKSTYNKNAKCIKRLFNDFFKGKVFLGSTLSLVTEKNYTAIVTDYQGTSVVIDSNGSVHEKLGDGWFKEVNGEPHYDIFQAKDTILKLTTK